MPQQERETLGEIVRSKKFFLYLGSCLTFDITAAAYLVNDIWFDFYEIQRLTASGLMLGNSLGFFAMNITLISWMLIDENSWLGKALLLFVGSGSLVICGGYCTIQSFNQGAKFYEVPFHHNHLHFNQTAGSSSFNWMQILTGANFLQGIVGMLLLMYLCLAFDAKEMIE